MNNFNLNIKNSSCQFCQSNFKDNVDIVQCPECNSLYHKECWIENSGCGVYGCNYKIKSENITTVSSEELLVNIKYLINENKFHEAISECKKILKLDRRNVEVKKLYNTAVHLINSKTKLIENGDIAFENKDYRSAEIYYSNSFKYLDEDEKEFFGSRISIIKEKIPLERKRKLINTVLISFICLLILSAVGYGYYYFYFLEEERAYAEIEKQDDVSNIQKMEIQISKYESFLRKYKQPQLLEKANEKINYLSGLIANDIYKSDWKNANRYLNKIDHTKYPVTYKELYTKIIDEAKSDFKNRLNNAKKLDLQKKYSDSKEQIENALEILLLFPESELNSGKQNLNSNISLLNKKISSNAKYSSISEEINEKLNEVKKYGNYPVNSKILNLKVKVIEFIDNTIVLARSVSNGELIAIKNPDVNLRINEILNFDCYKNGTMEIVTSDYGIKTVPLYIPAYLNDVAYKISNLNPELESVEIRLDYLYDQKSKLDSILNIPLKFN